MLLFGHLRPVLAFKNSLPPPSHFPPPPWHALWDCANPCCFQCLPHTFLTLHCPGVCRAEVGLQHLHSITQPHSGSIFIVNLPGHFLRGPAVVLLKWSVRVSLPWTWGCMPSAPRPIYGLSPLIIFADLFQ